MSNYETIHRALGRIEGKIDGIDQRLASGTVRMDKLEDRVHAGEKRSWKMAGASGVMAALAVIGLRLVPWATLIS